MFLNSPVTEQAATSVFSYSESIHVVKNVATTRKLSYLIRCYSVHISSQPCLANIERAKDSKAHVPPELRRIARQNFPGNNRVISFQLALVL